jgi:hypothetical protein
MSKFPTVAAAVAANPSRNKTAPERASIRHDGQPFADVG